MAAHKLGASMVRKRERSKARKLGSWEAICCFITSSLYDFITKPALNYGLLQIKFMNNQG
jgi:hypothetical protein